MRNKDEFDHKSGAANHGEIPLHRWGWGWWLQR